jgi:excinuclease UvrABC helicase subunit UvrB
MNTFELTSEYKPTGDQPQAIEQLVKSISQAMEVL